MSCAILQWDASYTFLININMPPLRLFSPHRHQRFIQYLQTLIISITLCATANLLKSLIRPQEPKPYHTSILTGEGWVIELLTRHPERIHCEFGMHAHAFKKLVVLLRSYGHENSRFVSLKEQLAIFIYTCVTGLPIRHVGERFQRSNDTISR